MGFNVSLSNQEVLKICLPLIYAVACGHGESSGYMSCVSEPSLIVEQVPVDAYD